jgi:hypothetical protein
MLLTIHLGCNGAGAVITVENVSYPADSVHVMVQVRCNTRNTDRS